MVKDKYFKTYKKKIVWSKGLFQIFRFEMGATSCIYIIYQVYKLFKIISYLLINNPKKVLFSIFEKVVHNSKGYKLVLAFI